MVLTGAAAHDIKDAALAEMPMLVGQRIDRLSPEQESDLSSWRDAT